MPAVTTRACTGRDNVPIGTDLQVGLPSGARTKRGEVDGRSVPEPYSVKTNLSPLRILLYNGNHAAHT